MSIKFHYESLALTALTEEYEKITGLPSLGRETSARDTIEALKAVAPIPEEKSVKREIADRFGIKAATLLTAFYRIKNSDAQFHRKAVDVPKQTETPEGWPTEYENEWRWFFSDLSQAYEDKNQALQAYLQSVQKMLEEKYAK